MLRESIILWIFVWRGPLQPPSRSAVSHPPSVRSTPSVMIKAVTPWTVILFHFKAVGPHFRPLGRSLISSTPWLATRVTTGWALPDNEYTPWRSQRILNLSTPDNVTLAICWTATALCSPPRITLSAYDRLGERSFMQFSSHHRRSPCLLEGIARSSTQ